MAIRRVAIILNCKAGALVTCNDPELMLRDSFARRDLEPLFITSKPGLLLESVTKALSSNPDAIVVAGGDGTFACAASVLAGSDLPLGLLPCGTMNLLARDLSLPINDLDASIDVVANGLIRTVDVGEVNNEIFLCASMLGLPARLGRTREGSRGSVWRVWSQMARAIWRQMLRARRLHMTLLADGCTISSRAAAVTITVNPIKDSTGFDFGRSGLDGGCFGIYILDSFGPKALWGLLCRVFFGRKNTVVLERRAHEIDINSDLQAMRVMNDGELKLLIPPLHYRIHRRALRVLVPAP